MNALKLHPDKELVFHGNLSEGVSSYLYVTNIAKNNKVGFKVKTTAPDSYCVRPKNGVLRPTETIAVDIRLKKGEFERLQGKETKFKILSVVVPENESNYMPLFERNELSEYKLRTLFIEDKNVAHSTYIRDRNPRLAKLYGNEGSGRPGRFPLKMAIFTIVTAGLGFFWLKYFRDNISYDEVVTPLEKPNRILYE